MQLNPPGVICFRPFLVNRIHSVTSVATAHAASRDKSSGQDKALLHTIAGHMRKNHTKHMTDKTCVSYTSQLEGKAPAGVFGNKDDFRTPKQLGMTTDHVYEHQNIWS